MHNCFQADQVSGSEVDVLKLQSTFYLKLIELAGGLVFMGEEIVWSVPCLTRDVQPRKETTVTLKCCELFLLF